MSRYAFAIDAPEGAVVYMVGSGADVDDVARRLRAALAIGDFALAEADTLPMQRLGLVVYRVPPDGAPTQVTKATDGDSVAGAVADLWWIAAAIDAIGLGVRLGGDTVPRIIRWSVAAESTAGLLSEVTRRWLHGVALPPELRPSQAAEKAEG